MASTLFASVGAHYPICQSGAYRIFASSDPLEEKIRRLQEIGDAVDLLSMEQILNPEDQSERIRYTITESDVALVYLRELKHHHLPVDWVRAVLNASRQSSALALVSEGESDSDVEMASIGQSFSHSSTEESDMAFRYQESDVLSLGDLSDNDEEMTSASSGLRDEEMSSVSRSRFGAAHRIRVASSFSEAFDSQQETMNDNDMVPLSQQDTIDIVSNSFLPDEEMSQRDSLAEASLLGRDTIPDSASVL